MAQQTFLDNVREWIGGLAWSIFLWSARMTEEEYFAELTRAGEQRHAPTEAGGDWICPKCHWRQDDYRLNCFYCGTPRLGG